MSDTPTPSKYTRAAELVTQLNNSAYIESIYPDAFRHGGLTMTRVALQGKTVEAYYQNRQGDKFPLSKEQYKHLFPDTEVHANYKREISCETT